jgi:hypothetical protein
MSLGYRVTVGNAGVTTRNGLAAINATFDGGGAADPIVSYLACLPAQYRLDEVRSQVIQPVRSAYTDLQFAGGKPGTHVGPATVACDSAAIVRRTILAGRDQVSTLKVGPCPDGASAAGILTDAYAALLGVFGSATITTFIAGATQLTLVPTILTPDGTHNFRDLESFHVGVASRVMRRRVVGIGE